MGCMGTLSPVVAYRRYRADKALEGHSIVCEQCCAPPMLCLLLATVRLDPTRLLPSHRTPIIPPFVKTYRHQSYMVLEALGV